MKILRNKQIWKTNLPFRESPNNTRVVFLQWGSQWGYVGRGGKADAREEVKRELEAPTGQWECEQWCKHKKSGVETPRTNLQGESHSFHCGETDHRAFTCPLLLAEQQGQLQINLDAQEETEEQQEEEHQLLDVMFTQGAELPNSRAYLDGCLMATAFKTHTYMMFPLVMLLPPVRLHLSFVTVLGVIRRCSHRCTPHIQILRPWGVAPRREQVWWWCMETPSAFVCWEKEQVVRTVCNKLRKTLR